MSGTYNTNPVPETQPEVRAEYDRITQDAVAAQQRGREAFASGGDAVARAAVLRAEGRAIADATVQQQRLREYGRNEAEWQARNPNGLARIMQTFRGR